MASGSQLFFSSTCSHTTTYTLLRISSLVDTIHLKMWQRPLSWREEYSLPVPVYASKTSLAYKSECSKLSVQPTNFLLPVRIVKLSASRWFPSKPLADTLVTLIFQNILSDGRSRQTANASSKLLSFSCRFQERPQLKKKRTTRKNKRKKVQQQ